MSDELALTREQIAELLEKYNVDVEEVDCSNAVLVVSTHGGEEIEQRVGKWFYPSSGERYFTFKTETLDHDFVEEYFTIIVLDDGEKVVTTLSLGILKYLDRCFDIFSFQDQVKVDGREFTFVDSPLGYLIEVASIESNRVSGLYDFTDAKHIEAKYLQRKRSATHYYQQLKLPEQCGENDFFIVNTQEPSSEHPWNINQDYTEEEMVSAKKRLDTKMLVVASQNSSDRLAVSLNDDLILECQRPTPDPNYLSCLLYDICAQSLSSASIPRTRLYVPWIISRDGEPRLMFKIVV